MNTHIFVSPFSLLFLSNVQKRGKNGLFRQNTRTHCGAGVFAVFKALEALISLGKSRFLNCSIFCEIPLFSSIYKIHEKTRNQLNRKVPWVRIPPAPPEITPA